MSTSQHPTREGVPTSGDAQALTRQVTRLLFELNHRLRMHLDTVAASLDLTPMQAKALHHLDEPCPMGDVADRLMCDASNVTGIVDRLEERALVQRTPDPADRRRKLLVRTEEGTQVRSEMHGRMLAGHPMVKGLSESELETLRDLLQTALDVDDT